MASDPSFIPVIRFPDQSASFGHGFQAGQIWEKLKRLDVGAVLEEMVFPQNRDLLSDLATHEKCGVEFAPTEIEEWVSAIFTKRQPFVPRIV